MKREYLLALLSSYLPMVAYAGSNFILVPVLLKALGERNFGIYMMLYSIAQYMSIGVGWLGGVAVRLIGVYEARKDEKKLTKVTALVFYYFIAYGTIVAFAAIFASQLLDLDFTMKVSVVLLGVYLFFNYLLQSIVNILFAYNMQIISNLLKTFPVIFYTIVTIMLLKYWQQAIVTPILALLVSVIVILPAVMKYSIKLGCFVNPFIIEKETIRETFLSVGFWNFLYGLLLISIMQDRIFLGFFVSPESVSKFTVLWTIPNFLVMVLWRVSEVLQPYFVRLSVKNVKYLRNLFIKNIFVVSGIGMLFGCLYALFGNFILSLWIGKIPDFSSNYSLLLAEVLLFFKYR